MYKEKIIKIQIIKNRLQTQIPINKPKILFSYA